MKKNVLQAGNFLNCIVIFIFQIDASQICEWETDECPENLDGQIIIVPSIVVAFSSKIKTCDAAYVFKDIYMIADGLIDNRFIAADGSDFKTYVNAFGIIAVDNSRLSAEKVVKSYMFDIQDKPIISSTTNDSSQMIFSEPIDSFVSSSPSFFSLQNRTVYQIKLKNDGNVINGIQHTSKLISVQFGTSTTSNHSIRINSVAEVGEESDGFQLNSENRNIPTIVQNMPYNVLSKIVSYHS